MSATMTLLQLRTAIRQRADMVNSSGVYTNAFITDLELTSYINQSYYELYDILIETYEDYYVTIPPVKITADGINNTFALPDGTLYSAAPALYKLYGVDVGLDSTGNALLTLTKFNFIDRNRYVFLQPGANGLGPFELQYRLVGGKIMFTPKPSAGLILQLWQYPRLTELVADGDIVDGISGWTEYIICDGAIKCGQKEETDVQVLFAQKAALEKRIRSAAQKRDAGAPQTISNTRRASGLYGGYPGRGGGQGGGGW